MNLKQKEVFQAHCQALHKKHFNGEAVSGKYPFVRRNFMSMWGQAREFNDGWQVQIAWHTLNLPEWLIDYIILHEIAHTVDTTRRYGAMHTPQYWALLRSVYPHTDAAERAMKQLRRRRGQYVTLTPEWLATHAEPPNGKSRGKVWKAAPKPVKGTPLIRPGETAAAAHKRFQEELAEKYGWEAS